jgi:capsid protein
MSAFAPLVFPAGIHDDLQFAKLVQAQVASCFALIHEQAYMPTPPAGGSAATGPTTTETQSDGSTRTIQGIAPGMTYYAKMGEKVTGFSPNVPNAEFFQHAILILTIIAVNLGIPVAVLLLDPTKTNFSGWRGAIDQARVGFKEIQRWMVSRFFAPTYRWQVRRWLDADPSLERLAAKSKVSPYRHKFNRPKWAYIEPLKDAQADKMRIDNNLISYTELCDERGDDWDERSTQIVSDWGKLIVKSIEEADAINGKYPDAKVHWRDLAGARTAELPQADEPEPEPGEKKETAA